MMKSHKGRIEHTKASTAAEKRTTKKSVSKQSARKLASRQSPSRGLGAKKEYLGGTNVCKVTFTFPKVAAPGAKSVCIVGDFNNWNIRANPMKRLKNGDYDISLELEAGREYQFRYIIDDSKWENDWNADKYVKSPYGDSDNSVIIV